MKFGRPEIRNAAADIADMKAVIEHREDGTASLWLHLTFGYAEIPLEGRNFNVSAREAMLRVVCEGVEIDPSTRFGELVRPNSSKTTVTQESSSKIQKEAGIGVTLDASMSTQGGSASGSAKARREIQHSSTSVANTEIESLRVEVLGGDRWRIREFDEPALLRGLYLGAEALCTVRMLERANRQRLEITLEIKQRDLVFNPKPGNFLGGIIGSTNQDKLAKILMAKSLHSAMASDRSFNGILVASFGTCDEDEE